MNDHTKKKIDYLFVYMLILALVLFVSGFYLGGVTVKKSYSKQALGKASALNVDNEQIIKYLQSDFVSFYYGILEPFNAFKEEHFSFLARINLNDKKYDYRAKSKELLDLSKTTLNKIAATNLSSSAPLLVNAKESYIASLQHYQKGIGALLNKESTPNAINKFNETWLLAQKQFYESVYEWEKLNQDQYEVANQLANIRSDQIYNLSFHEWKSLTLHQKNFLISNLLALHPYNVPYQPEDITIHIDALAYYDGLDSLSIESIGKAIDLLIASNSISNGDFHKEKDTYYSSINTPLIPLFLNQK